MMIFAVLQEAWHKQHISCTTCSCSGIVQHQPSCDQRACLEKAQTAFGSLGTWSVFPVSVCVMHGACVLGAVMACAACASKAVPELLIVLA